MKDVLIFGGTGFVGKHMELQCPNDYRVTTVGKNSNICNKEEVRKIIDFVKPSVVVNLASLTTVNESLANPRLCYDISFNGMLNILEVLVEREFKGKILYTSSSEVYGHPDFDALPLQENSSPLTPMSPYAVAKISAEYLCQYWYRKYGLKVIIARPFTHIGPGQSDLFSTSSFARQIAKIEMGLQEPIISVGNLNTTRDLTDVRDIARAYWLLVESGHFGEIYNVCSGMEIKINDVLNKLISLSDYEIHVITDKDKTRPQDQMRIKGSFDKINNHTGWRPEIKLSNTLSDLLKYWVNLTANNIIK